MLPFRDGVHLRLFFSLSTLPALLLPYINDRKDSYGKDVSFGLQDCSDALQDAGRKKVIVEFSSPNIGREFSPAHLRSTILGAFIANIHQAMGWDVVRMNYLGDWGKNLGLLAVGFQRFGSLSDFANQTDPPRYLHDVYAKIYEEFRPQQEAAKEVKDNKEEHLAIQSQGLFAERDSAFKKMEDGDSEAIELWKKFRDDSIEHYRNTYARMGIEFDEYTGESEVCLHPETLAEVEAILKDKGICEVNEEGSTVIDFEKHGVRLGTPVLRDRIGSTSYLLRDIASVFHRYKAHSFDRMLYVVCSEQDTHFRQLFKAVELMDRPDIAERLRHISFGRANDLSAQLGDAKLLGDFLDQCQAHLQTAIDSIPIAYPIADAGAAAGALGISGLVAQDLAVRRTHGYAFDLNRLIAPEGDTGAALQLSYARLCATIASMGALPTPDEIPSINYSSLCEEPWCDVLRLLARYPDVTTAAFKNLALEPGPILSYLYHVAGELTSCLDVMDDEDEGGGSSRGPDYRSRTLLFECVRQVLGNGMRLLGIAPIDTQG
jgi:arginyl-tRNA synthetase